MTPERIASLPSDLTDFFHRHQAKAGYAVVSFCKDQAHEAGWWKDPKTGLPKSRSWGELMALAHSEVSEALEGDRKSLKDDKLPHLDNRSVEIADLFIRIADTIGTYDMVEDVLSQVDGLLTSAGTSVSKWDFPTFCAELHLMLSRIYEAGRTDPHRSSMYIAILITMIVAADHFYYLRLAQCMEDKLAFNRERADHKLENRVLENGKAY